MAETEFLCLAVFRGKPIWGVEQLPYFAAGIDLATGRWVRLVENGKGHALKLQRLQCLDRGLPRRMKPLEVVSLNLEAPAPDRFHPENWILGSGEGSISFLRTVLEDEALNRLIRTKAEEARSEEKLFGSVTSDVTDVDEFKSSILAFHPEFLMWRGTREFNKGRVEEVHGHGPAVKGEFKFGVYDDWTYALAVADPVWERKIECHLPDSEHLENRQLLDSIDPTMNGDTLLTLTIDDGLTVPDRLHAVIAGVLLLPKLEDGAETPSNSTARDEA